MVGSRGRTCRLTDDSDNVERRDNTGWIPNQLCEDKLARGGRDGRWAFIFACLLRMMW